MLNNLFIQRNKFQDSLGGVEKIYADFNYPEEIESFVRYMPLSDDFDLSSVTNDEMNLRMHANWGKIFVYEATRVYVIASVASVACI